MRKSYFYLMGAVLVFGFLSVEATAQINQNALDRFKELNPRAKFYGTQFYDNEGFYEDIGTVNAIYGTALATGQTPIDSAWSHVNQLEGIYAREIGELVPAIQSSGQVLQGVMFNHATQTHKFNTFRFDQMVGELPVFRSGVGFLCRNEADNPLVVSGSNLKEMAGFVPGAVGAPAVTAAMQANVIDLMNELNPPLRSLIKKNRPLPLVISEEKNVIWAGVSNVPVEPELAVVFLAQRGSIQTFPNFQKYLIVAAVDDGEILLSETQIHQFEDVVGTVSGRASEGISALECDPEVPVRLPFAEVSIVGGNTVFADADGNFVVPFGGNNQVTVRSRLRGRYFELFDQGNGGSTPFIDVSAVPPGPVDFLHNPSANQEFPTANVNCYFQANLVRDFVLSFEPTFPTIATQTSFDINSNIDSSCNASYSGNAINFFRNAGNCNNTSIPDVVYHEYGHHLLNVTGNGQGQMGEGTGDSVGVLIEDEPITGNGFFESSCTNGIRNANNTKQYPCSGQIHDCGQLISGCVWSTRNELIQTEPQNYREINAGLFIGMLIARGQMQPGNSTIDPFITILYLQLDDDDSDIGNGTPHYQEIAAGFGAHNMDAPPLDLLAITYPDGRPELVNPAGGVEFTVVASALIENPAPGTGVLYVDNGNGFQPFPMTESAPNVYLADFPPTECATEVRYYFSVQAANGQTQFDPTDAPDSVYSALSAIAVDVAFEDDFETNTGWSVSGDATDGQWGRGVPAGGGVRGDPPTDGDGSGQCYLTDNVAGNSDVDGGSTILTSPTLDASVTGSQESVLSYYRWYSNNFGNDPEADIFVVDISNNNGSSWTRLETVGPTGPEVRGGWIKKSFLIRDFVSPSSQMRLRFNASDLSTGSVVEAAVDGIKIEFVECQSTVTTTPDSFEVVSGQQTGGTLSDLEQSDNGYVLARKAPTQITGGVDIEFQSTSNTETPSAFEFLLESSVLSRRDVVQTIELFNYNTGSFEEVDSRNASRTGDAVVTIAENGDLSRFVEAGTLSIEARVSYLGLTNRQRFAVKLDQVMWTITN